VGFCLIRDRQPQPKHETGLLDFWMIGWVGKRPEALAHQSINPPIHQSKKML
jgi:hypothetical protein